MGSGRMEMLKGVALWKEGGVKGRTGPNGQ